VFAIIHDDALNMAHLGSDWPHQSGVIIGDDGVLVVDATFLPSRAAATCTDPPAPPGRPPS
jgi:hypothetical protein